MKIDIKQWAGKSKGYKKADFNKTQLRVGTNVEMEHTTSKRLAERISIDHLVEDKDYYKKLKKIHKD